MWFIFIITTTILLLQSAAEANTYIQKSCVVIS